MTMRSICIAIVVLAMVSSVIGHARWKCPLPRDANDPNGKHISFSNTGNKVGACGPESGKWGYGSVTKLTPGWTTLTWEESISHAGSPFRIAILDYSEAARIVLLDHIPHNDASNPDYTNESTYQEYKISVNIPDVSCDKCSLQLLYVMTDKTVKCGIPVCYYNPADSACKGSTDPTAETCEFAPNNNVCVSENECFSNYHSCSDVIIGGTQDISSFAYDGQPKDWPYHTMKPQHYTLEASNWKNGWLSGVPSNFTTPYDSLTC